MLRKYFAIVLIATLFFDYPIESFAQTIIVSADSNMINALDPALTSQSVSDLAYRPTGVEQFLINILQGGTQVFIDQYSGHSNRGIVGGYEQLANYYNALPGVSATMPGGDFDSSSLVGMDLLITSMPNVTYTPSELQAMSELLASGGNIFFIGDSNNFSSSNNFINDALDYLGSGLSLGSVVIASPGWPFYTSSVTNNHALMAGVPNLSLAVSGSVLGGEGLAFYVHSGVEYAVLAIEDSGNTSMLYCDGFQPPMKNYPVKAKKNRAFPLKMQIFDTDGFEIESDGLIVPPVVQVIFSPATGDPALDVTDDVLASGHGSEGNQFVFTDEGIWQFNLRSTNYTAEGDYLVAAVSGDEAEYVIDPSCVTIFKVE